MILGVLLLAICMGAVICIIVNLIVLNAQIPREKIIYKYMPRTFKEEQENQPLVSSIFKSMFTDQTPWVNSVMSYDKRKEESVNKYYVSQI